MGWASRPSCWRSPSAEAQPSRTYVSREEDHNAFFAQSAMGRLLRPAQYYYCMTCMCKQARSAAISRAPVFHLQVSRRRRRRAVIKERIIWDRTRFAYDSNACVCGSQRVGLALTDINIQFANNYALREWACPCCESLGSLYKNVNVFKEWWYVLISIYICKGAIDLQELVVWKPEILLEL